VLRVLELARRFEACGASSFRAFVERLAAEAQRGEASEAPVVEEGTEGVRIMSVHKAKGLEFPVVVLCDPCAPAAPRTPSRLVDPARRMWAMPLAGCAPAELLADATALLERDREEVVRVAYVAATRARDLLVVPVVGDGELSGWLEPLNGAVVPGALERREARPATGCPQFGKESVLDRPEGLLRALSVSPGLHRAAPEGPEVVWWDPHVLDLTTEIEGGLRSNDLLVEDAASHPAAEAHRGWAARHAAAVEKGGRASVRVETATARSFAAPLVDGPEVEVELAAVESRDRARPRGKRFGTLVHAILAEVGLNAALAEIETRARAEGRRMGAPPDEVSAASAAVAAALQHPLLRRASRSAEVRREEALVHRLADGTILEGTVDLAFREGEGWVVVDFKTDAQPDAHARYAAQLRVYCAAISAATQVPARAAILAV
jgi:ATP-dependent exoDNAse (exonuclease V) beta subunit